MKSMIHKCKVHCYTLSASERETMGIKEDPGKWLPFAIDMGVITSVKMATDDRSEELYNKAVIFTTQSETFILDTPYIEMVDKWTEYIDSTFSPFGDLEPPSLNNDDDIEL